MAELAAYLEEHLSGFQQYDDGIVRKMIERVTVALCGELWYVLWLQREGYHVRLHESLAGTV